MTHALKTWPEFYQKIESGEKNFEVRKFDRPFKVGDILLLQEWEPSIKQYTGKETQKVITYMLHNNDGKTPLNVFGVFSDFCIMSIKEIDY